MAGLPFDAHPGEAFVYGYSTDVLGAVVEVVAGVTLDEFLETRILRPLGMLDTHFYLPEEKRDRLAVVYSLNETGLTRAPNADGIDDMVSQGAYVVGPRKSFSGGAGLLSTAEDYARFLQMILNGGELDGVRILSRKTVELMTVNHVGDLRGEELENSGVGFGLGFDVLEDLGERGTPGSWVSLAGGVPTIPYIGLIQRNSSLSSTSHSLIQRTN
jgi:CubicO group peptidase (beta-lactamase class C family)